MRAYSAPGVPDACLSLQNDFGADVNMLLFCCWAGSRHEQFEGELFARASEFSSDWAGGVVTPLRSARTWMKTASCEVESVPADAYPQLREQIKAVELLAEKMQLETLESLASSGRELNEDHEDSFTGAVANLALYAKHNDIEVNADVRRKLAVIIGAALPDCSHLMIEDALLRLL